MPHPEPGREDLPDFGYGVSEWDSSHPQRHPVRTGRYPAEEPEAFRPLDEAATETFAALPTSTPPPPPDHEVADLASDDLPTTEMSAVGAEPAGDPDSEHPAPPSGGRAGRNLPAAIGVGAALIGTVLASLLLWRPAFVLVVVLAAALGTWEMTKAVRTAGIRPPLPPLLAGGAMMIGLAWSGGPGTLPFTLAVTLVALMIWRLGDGVPGYARDVTAGMLIATYVPFLLCFGSLLVRPEDGEFRVLVALLGVVLSDTGGYVTGVFTGRHPMAPSVSPKKSWEGFAGSVLWTAVGEAVLLSVAFGTEIWLGALVGVVLAGAAVLGDLTESLIKRDLGVKDMSSLLPGHGGLMDRLDSILFAVPVAYVMLSVVVPIAA